MKMTWAPLFAALLALSSSVGATPDQGDYTYSEVPQANRCSTSGRPTACVRAQAAPAIVRDGDDAAPPVATRKAKCGDGICSAGETNANCLADCF